MPFHPSTATSIEVATSCLLLPIATSIDHWIPRMLFVHVIY